MVEGLETTCFRTIPNIGGVRSSYVEAIQKARQGNFEGARGCTRAGQEMSLTGHKAHSELIQKEAQGEQVGGPTILIHAEDQFMNAEGFKIITEEILTSYGRIVELEERLES